MNKPTKHFIATLQQQLDQLEKDHLTRSNERIISKVLSSTKVVIRDEVVTLFNSNDYLGLRKNPDIASAEHQAAVDFGTGAGAVRFISGTLAVHKELESTIAAFHGREDAILFSSAYAANLSALTSLINYGPKQENEVIVLSDELNHRSIIDGIRLSGISSKDKTVYKHMDYDDLESQLERNSKIYQRALVVTDGIFSMLGEKADLHKIDEIVKKYDPLYPEGVIFMVDDCHGVGTIGKTGRGSEEIDGVISDILVGTFGKGFGCEGGYAVGSKVLIKYLREKSAPYIFSNPISPAAAAGAAKSVSIVDGAAGRKLHQQSAQNIAYFTGLIKKTTLLMAHDSIHPIQPLLIKDSARALQIARALDERYHIIVTPITFPAVAKGAEEIRIQISAAHTKEDMKKLVEALVALQ